MGGRGSKEEVRRSFRSADSFRSRGYAEEQYSTPRYGGDVPAYQNYPTSTSSYDPPHATGYSHPYSGPRPPATRKTPKLDRRYSQISDNYNSLEQVTNALEHAGLETSNLIVGIDFTKSNEWLGKISFHNRSLHHISDIPNPYEHAISIIGQTLSAFIEDNLIPCYGFGDDSTHDQDVFSFFPDERPCTGFSEALSRYREIVPHLRLAGPKSFAPIIEKAMTIVKQSGGQFHVLLIIADGQAAYLSSKGQKTVDAIVKASEFPLSIVLVGVGDGPWDMMKEFDDNIPARSFDNFQFVNFTEIMSKNTHQKRKDTEFDLAALMEICSQYKATIELGILGKSARSPQRVVLPPPDGSRAAAAFGSKSFQSTSFQKSSTPYTAYDSPTNYAPSASSASWEQVTEALARAGLESANLIVGIDFTKGNEWTGKFSVHYRSMHHISDIPNLYEHAISIIGQTLSSFEKDNLIFGDASTHDQDVFSFFPDERPRTGLEALSRYKEIFKHSILAGPASFAPSIKKALTVVEQSGGQYHVLLIIADGQITQSLVTQSGYLSSLDQETVDAIVNSSEFPLSIVLVGVGDGPWDMIKKFDHNFQFVNFTEIMSKETHQKRKETEFALAALREIPSQYKATIELGILGKSARSPQRVALPPPDGSRAAAAFGSKSFQSTSFQKSSPSYTAYDSPTSYDPSAPSVSWEQVTEALARAGLESSNLIVGVDFTKSNEWTGKFSFHNRSLHHISDTPNPYEYAISIIGQTLSAFDEDNLIPCYGFGDASTHDQDVFSFFPDERPCTGFSEALSRYREIVPHLRLAGPTSFAPIIEKAMTIVEQSGGQYHVLLIIADGQVTRSVDTQSGYLSLQEQKTVDAIVKASEFPLSIVLVGVGDGPWNVMKEFDDNIPARSFDNFQFVNFTEIMSKNTHQERKETEFALAALMKIPSQYKATIELGILGKSARSPQRVALPPPDGSRAAAAFGSKSFQSTSLQKSSSPYTAYDSPTSYYPSAPSVSWEEVCCPICPTERKNLAFGCGHQTCYDCGQNLVTCPICRSEIVIRIRLY